MTRSRHIPHALLMESLAALELAEATGQAIGVSFPGVKSFYVAHDPSIGFAGLYSSRPPTIRVQLSAREPSVRATMEHELIHHMQFAKLRSIRRPLPEEPEAFDPAQRALPHGAQILEYYPNIVSDAEDVLRALQRSPHFDVRRLDTRKMRPELPEALQDRYKRDLLTEVARRLPRVRRNPNRQITQRLDELLPALEAIRDDADVTERVGRQALRMLTGLRREHADIIARKTDQLKALRAELEEQQRRADYNQQNLDAHVRMLQAKVERVAGELGRERMARAERDVQIANLEAELAAAKKVQTREIVRMPLAAEASAEERRRREAAMRKEAKRRR